MMVDVTIKPQKLRSLPGLLSHSDSTDGAMTGQEKPEIRNPFHHHCRTAQEQRQLRALHLA